MDIEIAKMDSIMKNKFDFYLRILNIIFAVYWVYYSLSPKRIEHIHINKAERIVSLSNNRETLDIINQAVNASIRSQLENTDTVYEHELNKTIKKLFDDLNLTIDMAPAEAIRNKVDAFEKLDRIRTRLRECRNTVSR